MTDVVSIDRVPDDAGTKAKADVMPAPVVEEVKRLACGPVDLLPLDKLKKTFERGGVVVVGDGAYIIEGFEPIPFRASELETYGAGQLVMSREFMLSTIGFARAVTIAGFGLAKREGAPIAAWCELPGGITLAPGSTAKFPRGSVVVSAKPTQQKFKS